MTGAEAQDGGGPATEGAAPVSSPHPGPLPRAEREKTEKSDSPFRQDIQRRVKVLRSLRHPTVAQIEVAQFWEEYLARTLYPVSEVQKDVSEPIQKY